MRYTYPQHADELDTLRKVARMLFNALGKYATEEEKEEARSAYFDMPKRTYPIGSKNMDKHNRNTFLGTHATPTEYPGKYNLWTHHSTRPRERHVGTIFGKEFLEPVLHAIASVFAKGGEENDN